MNRPRLAAVALLASIAVLVPAQIGAANGQLPIPALPTDFLTQPFTGTAVTANPLPHEAIKQNPHLAANGTNSMHNDAYASDAYEGLGPLGHKLKARSAWYGVSECATVAFDSRGRMVGLCGDLGGFKMRLINPTKLTTIGSDLTTSKRNLLTLQNPFTDICGGTYFSLDDNDVAYVLTIDKQVWKVRVDEAGFTKLGSFDASPKMAADDCMVATLPDWDGNIFYVTQKGQVGVINPETGSIKTMQFPAGEGIYNSISGDESGAIYIVTDHKLYAVEADASGQPRTRWEAAYDRGTQQKSGQLSQGSGTTVTVIGDDLVAITDNAEPRMNVLFYKRDGANPGQLLCKVPVFGAGASDTENSLIYAGGLPNGPRSVIVENNYGYEGVQSTMFGATSTGGVAKVSINPDNSCQVDWTNPIVSPTPVPKVSLAAGLLYVYAKPKSNFLDDSWYFTAIDVRTGATKWQQRTGNGIQWNNHYAAIYLGPDGTAYMPTLTGMISFKDS
ncbi:hypothetical protein ABIE44_002089 [Marmoricola sp. OAE513]|uniref:PQQ-binding-like beta-propeller repeat protein n=1 Tax=Marmoricola sp. OAE513 TaxID=2817894 RepID=UPI001AE45B1D